MKTTVPPAPCVVIAFAVAVGLVAQAETLISNLPGNDGTQSATLNDLRNKGMGFTMPAGSAYYLDRAVLRLYTTGPNVQPIVEIWSDVGGIPSASLITLTNPTFEPSGIANYEFTPPSAFTLEAGRTYWVITYGTANGDHFGWMASDPYVIPIGLATHFGARFDEDGPPPTGSSYTVNSYAIEGTLVPEPICQGDCSCDGHVDFGDINPFVAALGGETPCRFENCDINADGGINFADINPFVAILVAGGGPCD